MLTLPNDWSPRQKAEKWELLWGKGGTENTEESGTREDTESPCSQELNGDIKRLLFLPPAVQKLNTALLPTGWMVWRVSQQEELCVLVPGHEHACERRRWGQLGTAEQPSSPSHFKLQQTALRKTAASPGATLCGQILSFLSCNKFGLRCWG